MCSLFLPFLISLPVVIPNLPEALYQTKQRRIQIPIFYHQLLNNYWLLHKRTRPA